MRVGLIDAGLFWDNLANGRRYGKTKADIFPNLALMKLSAYHKQRGDDVSLYMGFEPYVMVYDKTHAAPFYRSLQRWVNMRAIFHKIKTFEEYDKRKAKE